MADKTKLIGIAQAMGLRGVGMEAFEQLLEDYTTDVELESFGEGYETGYKDGATQDQPSYDQE